MNKYYSQIIQGNYFFLPLIKQLVIHLLKYKIFGLIGKQSFSYLYLVHSYIRVTEYLCVCIEGSL